MNGSTLKQLILSKLKSYGFVTSGTHSKTEKLAQAIAEAVVEHIKADAKVTVASGSSAGNYKVE